jgi:hypothetical protein
MVERQYPLVHNMHWVQFASSGGGTERDGMLRWHRVPLIPLDRRAPAHVPHLVRLVLGNFRS